MFCTCLLLAAAAWLLTRLSSSYSYEAKGILTFKNAPQLKAFHSLQSDTVTVTVQGNGWQMLFSGMEGSPRTILVDLHRLEHQNYVALNTQLNEINSAKDSSQRVVAIEPDTLYFDMAKRMSRQVPVQLLAAINCRRQFNLSAAPVITPAYVTVSGPARLIDGIQAWKTDSLKLNRVSESVSTRLNLQPVHGGNISVEPKVVQVQLPVDEFTEKTLEIPVKLINNPHYYNVKLFPQKVKVTFMVALGRYRETDEDFFEASADLNLWENHQYSLLPVALTHTPAFCRIVRIEPRNVDFIIKK